VKEKQKHILRCAVILLIIVAVSGALLFGVNMLTKGMIEENNEKTLNRVLSEVMPKADEFVPADAAVYEAYGAKGIYTAKSGGVEIGACVIFSHKGHGGDIAVVVGVENAKMAVTGVRIMSTNETDGLGASIAPASFTSQYIGKQYDPDHPLVMNNININTYGNMTNTQMRTVSGSTIKPKEVTAIVNKAMAAAFEQRPYVSVDISDDGIVGGGIDGEEIADETDGEDAEVQDDAADDIDDNEDDNTDEDEGGDGDE